MRQHTREELEGMNDRELAQAYNEAGLGLCDPDSIVIRWLADDCLAEIEKRGLQSEFLFPLGAQVTDEDIVDASWHMGQLWRDDREVIIAAILAAQAQAGNE